MEQVNQIVLDAAYPLPEAAKLMGLKGTPEVLRLHDQGKITVRMRKVREGGKGRPVLLGAEIKRFNTNLPERPRRTPVKTERPIEPLIEEPAERASKKKGLRRVGKVVAETYD